MRRVSPKAVLRAVFCAGLVVYWGGCVNPVNLSTFVSDKDVIDIIDKGSGSVNITLDSDPGLTVGNRRITGLQPQKYYMVEEWHEDRSFLGVQFVSASGERSDKLANIGTVSEREWEITGLTNNNHYRVRAAGPLLNYDVPYNFLTPPGIEHFAENTGGAITLPSPDDGSYVIYTLTPPADPPYDDIAEVSITSAAPAGVASAARRQTNGEIIALIGQETVTDYVFFRTISQETFTFNFYFLRVTAKPGPITPPEPPKPPETGDLHITVGAFNLDHTAKTFSLTPNPITFSQANYYSADAALKTITVTFNYTASSFDAGSIKWTWGAKEWTGGTLSINFADDANVDLLVIGWYTITVEATIAGVVYSSSLVLVIE